MGPDAILGPPKWARALSWGIRDGPRPYSRSPLMGPGSILEPPYWAPATIFCHNPHDRIWLWLWLSQSTITHLTGSIRGGDI